MKSIATLRTELHGCLMCYGRSPSPESAGHVAACLEKLVLHPDFHADLRERCLCKQMLVFWRLLADSVPARGNA